MRDYVGFYHIREYQCAFIEIVESNLSAAYGSNFKGVAYSGRALYFMQLISAEALPLVLSEAI